MADAPITPGSPPPSAPPPKPKGFDEDWHVLLGLAGLIAMLIIGVLQHQISVVAAVAIMTPIVGGGALYAHTQNPS